MPFRARQFEAADVRRWQRAHDDGVGGRDFHARFGLEWASAKRAAVKLGLELVTRPRVVQSRVCRCGAALANGASQCLTCYRRSRPELFDRRLPVRRAEGGDER